MFTAFADGTPGTNPATVYIDEGTTLNLRVDEDETTTQTITLVATDDDNTGSNTSVDTITYTVEGSDDFNVAVLLWKRALRRLTLRTRLRTR